MEEFLYTNPKIKDVTVIGVPSGKYGEEVMAYVILKEGANASEEEIRNFCKNGMSRYKASKYVRFVKRFPMTASGKIQKYKLREEAKKEMGL